MIESDVDKFLNNELKYCSDIERNDNGTITAWWVDDDKDDYYRAESRFGGEREQDYDGEAWYGLTWTIVEIRQIMADLQQEKDKMIKMKMKNIDNDEMKEANEVVKTLAEDLKGKEPFVTALSQAFQMADGNFCLIKVCRDDEDLF